jgi:hypothetical protein
VRERGKRALGRRVLLCVLLFGEGFSLVWSLNVPWSKCLEVWFPGKGRMIGLVKAGKIAISRWKTMSEIIAAALRPKCCNYSSLMQKLYQYRFYIGSS